MKLTDFDYLLPEELIAQEPLPERSDSRLLVFNRAEKSIEHRAFPDIMRYLNAGDCLILNDTRVMPARLLGKKIGTDSPIEFLILRRANADIWEVILKPGKKAKIGSRFTFGEGQLLAEVIDIVQDGNRLVRFEYDGIFETILDKIGIVPLPPYITQNLDDKERYQTVFSKNRGSSAAPTAGLHFTQELLEKISKQGVRIAYVTLHVGLGTFRPVKVQDVREHIMHEEYFSISQETVDIIQQTKQAGKKVVAVGTTSVRVLESTVQNSSQIKAQNGFTDIFIYPGFEFKMVDAIITNFHLPGSTLIMLVSAFAGRENILQAYAEAIAKRYRFFSFGDAMFLL